MNRKPPRGGGVSFGQPTGLFTQVANALHTLVGLHARDLRVSLGHTLVGLCARDLRVESSLAKRPVSLFAKEPLVGLFARDLRVEVSCKETYGSLCQRTLDT